MIVGSGPGGATLAYRLAAAGKKVVVVEAGAKLEAADFTKDIGKTLASHFWDGGTRSVRGNVFFPTLQVRALGGGSVFNSAICMRPLDSALQRWRDESGLDEMTPEGLDPFFRAVEKFYNIRPTPESAMGRRNQLFREACDTLGWSSAPADRFTEGCQGSGNCLVGCPNHAKNSMDRRGIAEAVQLGATVYTSVHVDELILTNGKARGIVGTVVDPKTHDRRYPVRIGAACTILAAGAIGTPVVMRRSGLTRDAIGNRLMFHPSCYVVGVFDEEVNPWNGAGLVDLRRYPRLAAYLESHREKLSGRHVGKKAPANWYRTIDRVSEALRAKPKLYLPDFKGRIAPVLDNGRTYPHHNLYFVASDEWDLEVLGGLLLSDVAQFFIEAYGVRMRGGYLRFQAQYVRRIRVPRPHDVSPALAKSLKAAFETHDVGLANSVAGKLYRLSDVEGDLFGHRS